MTNTVLNCLLFGLATVATASRGTKQPPSRSAVHNAVTPQGCFAVDIDHLIQSSSDFFPMQKGNAGYAFLSSGVCGDFCKKKDKPVMLLHKNQCFCADVYPMRSALAADSACNWPCSGYAAEACGGDGTASVYNVGLELNVKHMDEENDLPQGKETKDKGTQREPQGSEEGERTAMAGYKAAFEYAGYLAQKSWGLSKEASVAAHGFFCSILDCGRDEAEKDVEKGYESDDTIDELKEKKRE